MKKAHSLGLQAGFYINNCICGENQWRGNETWESVVYEGTAKAILAWDFDGVKIDSCSEFTNMTRWAELFAASGKPMVLENCHNSDGQDPCPEAKACPATGVCPYNLWRLGRDIGASWGSIYSNLQDVIPWNQGTPSLSRPGRWGYPDMMQVGQLASYEEDRAHFGAQHFHRSSVDGWRLFSLMHSMGCPAGAWAVVSSPLTLGYDLTDDSITEHIWPIISSRHAIAINHAWAGSPGRLVDEMISPHAANASLLARRCGDGAANACCTHHDGPPNSPPHYDGTGSPPLCGTQVWAKPLSTANGSVAVLLLNNQDTDLANVTITVRLNKILAKGFTGPASVFDVWAGSMLHASVTTSFESDAFGGHDSRFYIVTPTKASAQPAAEAREEGQCEQRCAGVGDGSNHQPQFMHCCVGLNATSQTPSCAMGCLMGKHTASLKECRESCDRAHGQCSFSSAATGGATLNLCASCASGAPGDCRSRFASGRWGTLNVSSCTKSFNKGACNITDNTCSVQLVEDWSPVRGCVVGDCYQGCAYQHGCGAL